MATFAYDDAVADRYPTIRAGVVHATGLANGPSPPGLLDRYRDEQTSASERLRETTLADLPQIAAWRRAFTRFGAKPTQHRNAAEALLRRLAKRGDIPTINALVDVGNLVSVRHAMPVAVFDQATVSGSMAVRFASGDERFMDLGSSEGVHPDPGEVVFVDDDDVVHARRWCWRQSAQSATGPSTAEAFIVVEGHHDTAGRDAGSALADLTSLLAAYQPQAQVRSYLLSPANPRADESSGVEDVRP
jgi:DNA/RNA-binding domain of Phe-tRNA-synthetase-like protein